MNNTRNYDTKIRASFENVWNIMMDEIEHPDVYSKNILKVKVLERFHNGVLRVVSVPDADVRQRITFEYEQGTMVSELVGHPSLVGTITESLHKGLPADSETTLRCNVEWESIDTGVGEMIRRNVERFFAERTQRVKARAEVASV